MLLSQLGWDGVRVGDGMAAAISIIAIVITTAVFLLQKYIANRKVFSMSALLILSVLLLGAKLGIRTIVAALVIDIMEEQKNISNMGGTMRLGAYECVLKQGSRVFNIYKKEHIQERHRHRYEFNNEFQQEFEKNGMMCVGRNPESDLVEIVEIPGLKWVRR